MLVLQSLVSYDLSSFSSTIEKKINTPTLQKSLFDLLVYIHIYIDIISIGKSSTPKRFKRQEMKLTLLMERWPRKRYTKVWKKTLLLSFNGRDVYYILYKKKREDYFYWTNLNNDFFFVSRERYISLNRNNSKSNLRQFPLMTRI